MGALLRYLGKMVLLAGLLELVPAAVAVLLGEPGIAPAFLAPALPAVVAGYLLGRYSPGEDLRHREAFTVAALSWLIFPLLGAVPFILALGASPLDACFEAMSGFTTTGLSVFSTAMLPGTFIFWRSFSQWVGGIGVILMFLAVVGPTTVASKFYLAEGRTERLEPSIVRTANAIIYIYVYLTLAGILFLYLAGSGLFNSINITFTAIATGGFSPMEDSYASTTVLERIVVMVLMLAGATSFALHRKWMSRDIAAIYRNPEVRLLLAILFVFSFLLYEDGNSLIDSMFQTTSAITCTGLSTVTVSGLNEHSIFFLILLMITGGGYGSTSGAIKLIRVLVVIKAVKWYVRKISMPARTVLPFKIGGKTLEEGEVLVTILYVVLYMAFLLFGVFVFVLLDHPLIDSVFEVASAQGNVGLSVIASYTALEKL
ncbi:MAG: TrkH family potassium uptake protein, partial [Euryarchaeota archaeon]|nr:TrkH family potassium uptake protein [Euryarchaeota archaeon]